MHLYVMIQRLDSDHSLDAMTNDTLAFLLFLET